MQDKISVIMPAYNEGDNIYHNISETVRVFNNLRSPYEIIVVDDGSRDNTYQEAQRAAEIYPTVLVKKNDDNQGKGSSLKYGFQLATGELIVFLDADLDLHPEQLDTLFQVMDQTGSDVVIGSKRHPHSQLNYPLDRKIISNIYALLLRLLFRLPLKDTQTGLKIYKTEVLRKIFPRILCKGYAFDVELLANAHGFGYKITEAPVILNFRREARWGRIGLYTLYKTGLDTLAIFYRMYILKYYQRALPQIEAFPRVSIIIAAKDFNHYAQEAIERCRNLNYPDFEIIFLPDPPCQIPYEEVKVVPTGPVVPSKKRDLGVAASSGQIIAFLDDDAYPVRDWLMNAARYFNDPDIAAIGGPAATPEEDSTMQKASGAIYASLMMGGNQGYRYIPKTYREVDDYPTCNLIVKKSDFEKVGGFNTNFWPGEDTFLCLKLTRELKRKIVYDPDVLVYHHRRPLFLPHLRQIKSYGLHRGYFVKRFPKTSLRISYFLPTLLILGLSLGWLTVFSYPMLFSIYLLGLGIYLTMAFLTGLKSFRLKMALGIFSGIILSHFTYGICFIKGLMSRRLPEE